MKHKSIHFCELNQEIDKDNEKKNSKSFYKWKNIKYIHNQPLKSKNICNIVHTKKNIYITQVHNQTLI